MVAKKYKNRRAYQSRRVRKQRGGDSAAYTFGQAVAPGAPYASEVIQKVAGEAAARPGFLASAHAGTGGLPGFAGGGKRRSTRRRKQRGGRYTFDVAASEMGTNPFVPVSRIACEGGMVNTAPAGAAPNPVPASMSGGAWRRKHRKQAGGVGGVDSAFYAAPNAGYSNQPSTWVSSTGTPSMLQVPYEARTMNPACLKTGGGKRKNRRSTRRKH